MSSTLSDHMPVSKDWVLKNCSYHVTATLIKCNNLFEHLRSS